MEQKKINVLVLITLMDRAGAETMMMNYLRNIDRDRIQMDFLINREEKSDYESEIEHLGSHIYHMSPIYPGKFRRYKKEFKQFLLTHKEYQVIYSHLEERSCMAMRIAKKMGVPVRIVHAHSVPKHLNLKYPVRLFFKYRLKGTYTKKAACGRQSAEWLFGDINGVTIIKNAVDTKQFTFRQDVREKTRKSLKIKEKPIVVGHVGRFTYEKNHEFLLEIFKEVVKQRPDSRLLLVGGGKPKEEQKTKQKIREKVRELHLTGNVIFLGVRKDIPELMQAMDILVMPSRSEGFPMTLVEAQSVGNRCLVSDRVPYDINITNEVQFLSLENEPVEWANKIISFCQSSLNREAMHQKIIDQGYDIRDCTKEMENLFLDNDK